MTSELCSFGGCHNSQLTIVPARLRTPPPMYLLDAQCQSVDFHQHVAGHAAVGVDGDDDFAGGCLCCGIADRGQVPAGVMNHPGTMRLGNFLCAVGAAVDGDDGFDQIREWLLWWLASLFIGPIATLLIVVLPKVPSLP